MANYLVITCTSGGFAIECRARTGFIAGFDEVAKATIWKRDELTTDLVCVEIALSNGASCIVHEEMPGFDTLMEKLERLDGFDLEWRSKVILPPFASNELVAYERDQPPEPS